MNFEFSAQEREFFANVNKAMTDFSKNCDPESGNCDTIRDHVSKALSALTPTGYLKMGLDEEKASVSGSLALMGAMEQLAGISPSIFLSVEMSMRLFGRILNQWGAVDLKTLIMKKITENKDIGAVAFSEKTMNAENGPLDTIGIRDGDQVIVNGSKSFVINGPIADWYAVVGRFDERTVVFLIEKEAPGLQLSEPIATMGYNGVAICRLILDGCKVPVNRVIGPNESRQFWEKVKLWENQILIAAALGNMKNSFETALDYAKSHHSGGKPIIHYQEVGFKLSEMLTLYQTSQLLAYRSAWMADHDPKGATELTLCAKVFGTESAESVAGKALQILSGTGYLAGNKAERAYRYSKYTQIAGVSTEIARMKIGEAALGTSPKPT